MFSIEERGALRRQLVERARRDDQVTGCAHLGSAARGDEDDWSDIDLALQLAEDVAVEDVVARWTAWLKQTHEVVDHLDVHASGALYRVFLLRSSLQVDLSFWPHHAFRAVGGPVQLVFGDVGAPEPAAGRRPVDLVRSGWLHALHARSALARDRPWQVEMMLAGLRQDVVALACVRHGLEPTHGRQADELPADVMAPLTLCRASGLGATELQRSLRATIDLFLAEVAEHDATAAASLAAPMNTLVTAARRGGEDHPGTTERGRVARLLGAMAAYDETEGGHLAEARRWVHSGADLYRAVSSPVEPRQHLVSYFLVVDSADRLVLLGDHVKSGLWLPSGGHVEPDEDPADTVRRECREELGVQATFHPELGATPLFVTVTETVGSDPHRDVSLWYVLEFSHLDELTPDPGEYTQVRWWARDDLRRADPSSFDPHLGRMLDKLEAGPWQ